MPLGYATSTQVSSNDPITDGTLDQEGSESEGYGKGGKPDQGEISTYADTGRGPLLDLDPDKAAKLATALWMRDERTMANRKERWKVNRWRRMGNWMARLKWDKLQDRATAYLPPGTSVIPPALNKMSRLCRRLVSILWVDPPVPECTPMTDAEEDRDAAELSSRVLLDASSAPKLDVPNLCRRASSISCDAGSGFIRIWTDPSYGGSRPKAIQARPPIEGFPDATPDDALVDPQTGGPWMGETSTKYVTPGGKFTDDPDDADREWLPGLCPEILDGRRLRFIPATAYNIEEAEGVVIATMKPLGELKNMPGIGDAIKALSDQDLVSLLSWTLPGKYDIVQGHPVVSDRGRDRGTPGMRVTKDEDDQLVTTLTVYMEACPQYPRGAYCVFGGNKFRLVEEEWCNPETGEGLLAPIAQFKQLDEGDEDEPYGYGMCDTLGPGNEMRGAQTAAWQVFLDRLNRQKWLIPLTANVQPSELQNPAGSAIYYQPGGGEPKLSEVPQYPASAPQFLNFISQEMDDESGLSPSAQGLNPPEVQSGLHAQQLIEQTIVGLSGIKQNAEMGVVRLWRIMLEQIRAFYETEQVLQIVGDDGQHKVKAWTAADLGGTKDVRIQRGSMSMLSPSSKAAVAEHLFQLQVISPEELRHMALANSGGMLGLQDDPHRNRIARQIAEWEAGPPEDWQPPAPPQPGPPDPMTGQPTPPPPAPPDPYLAEIFDQRASDTIPDVVSIRLFALGRCISGTKYGSKPAAWRAGLDAEFQRMGQASQASQPQPRPPWAESVAFRDLPPDVQAQAEQQMGLTPSQMPPEAIAAYHAAAAGKAAGNQPKPPPVQAAPSTVADAQHNPAAPRKLIPDSGTGQPLPQGVVNPAAQQM